MNRVLEKTIPAITLEDMRNATAKDPELSRILEEKRNAKKSSLLIRGKKLVLPKSL